MSSDSSNTHRGSFASKVGIVLATAGSSVGLGNVWRFPVETGENGGAAFILIYLACVIFLGVPMMTAEFIIGRRTHKNIADAYRELNQLARRESMENEESDRMKNEESRGARRSARRDAPCLENEESEIPSNPESNPHSSFIIRHSSFTDVFTMTGYAGMICVTLILAYYSVVAGWTLKYAIAALSGQMSGVTDDAAYFTAFSTSTWAPLACTIAFLVVTHLIIERGVQNGIERVSKVLMPLLLLLMVMLAVGAMTMPGAADGIAFLLRPDFSKIDSGVVLSALGQAFFSLSIAIGCLATYASYFKHDVNLLRTSADVVGIDTLVAILSGFIIFPAVFSVGVTPDAGPGLVFVTLPNIFSNLFGHVPALGYIFSLMFYGLLVLAALTSTISMHEEVTAFFVDHYGLGRRRAAACMTTVCIVLGTLCSLSFGPLSDVRPFFGRGFFDAFNDVTALWIMPLSGIVLSIFVGWRLPRSLVIDELTNHHTLRFPPLLFHAFFLLIRWVAPIAITLIFIDQFIGH